MLQSSRQFSIGTKTEIQIIGKEKKKKKRKSRDKLMDTLSLTKEAKIYNVEKIVFSTSGAGKTGQLYLK